LLRIGQLFIVSVPSEFTTMSGRRVRKAVRQIVEKSGIVPPGTDVLVTIAGLGNSWNHYTTTFEEYQAQRYEAASTIYGPHTLSAYLQEFRRITNDLVTGADSASDPPPEDLTSKLVELNPGVIFDSHPWGHKYGSVREDAQPAYKLGERVDVTFQSANPRNNLRTQDTFLTVERQDGDSWKRVATDGDWETYFRWKNTGIPRLSAESTTTVTWNIPTSTKPGNYRVCHFGDYKEITGNVNSFSGCSGTFAVGEATLV
jgi:neutral ceramidase